MGAVAIAHDMAAAPALPASPDATVAVLIPVLNRPERVAPLLDSLGRTEGYVVRPVFVANYDDADQRAELDASGFGYLVVDWSAGPGDYARKINTAIRKTREPWIFTAADDLCFCHDWLIEAMRAHQATQAPVVGTNDLGNQEVQAGLFATHCLVRRDYTDLGTIEGHPGLLSEAYDHNFVDRELADTARHRGAWTYAPASHVEHLHPHWGLGPHDSTYAKGQTRFREDAALYQSRRRLWSYQ